LGCGDVNYVKPEASSTSELIYELMEEESVDEDIAKAVYIGIIHDTGIFQYSNTSPNTLRIAAKLIEYGFDFPTIIDETFYEKTYTQNQLLGRALLESIIFMDGRCIVSCIDKKTLDFYNATSKDLEGIVSQLRIIKGVECAVFMYEIGTLEYKVSLRSCKYIDVAKVASYFGGGGHIRAAGCTMNGTFYDVINNISARLELQFLEHEGIVTPVE
jgi:phosphoesterase RecJ-like protein